MGYRADVIDGETKRDSFFCNQDGVLHRLYHLNLMWNINSKTCASKPTDLINVIKFQDCVSNLM